MSYNSKYKGAEVEEILDSVGNKVDKVEGKGLSTEDFTTALKTKLDSLSNYDDTTISQAIEKLRTDFDTLVSGDTTTAIKTFNEVIAFLDGLEDTESLDAIIASIEQQIAGKYTKPSTGIPKSDLASDVQTSLSKADTALQSYTEQYKGTVTGVKMNGTTKNPSSGVVDLGTVITEHQDISGKQDKLVSGTNIKTINGMPILGSGDLKVEGGAKVYTWDWDGEENGTLSQEDYDGIFGADIVYISVMGGTPTQAIIQKQDVYIALIIQFIATDLIDVVGFSYLIEIDENKSYHVGVNLASVPSKTSQLENDSNFISSDNLKTINGQSILGSGNIVIEGGTSSGSAAYPLVEHGTSDTTFTLTPNTFHVWDEVASLDLSFGSETSGVANEFLFQFTSGATATTLTLPDDIKWANDTAPTIAENMIYQISVLRGLASVLEFSNPVELIENKAIVNYGASNFTITFQYPVASDLIIYYKSDSINNGQIPIAVGESSVTGGYSAPFSENEQITLIRPESDNIYRYTF